MKQFVKNNYKLLIAIIITTIVVTSGTVYAAQVYFAKDISFELSQKNKDNGFQATNVEDALNELYNEATGLNCVTGSFSHLGNSDPSWTIDFGLVPKIFTIFTSVDSQNFEFTYSYNKNISNKIIGAGYYLNGKGETTIDVTSYFTIDNTKLIHNGDSAWYTMLYDSKITWVACK